MLTRYGRGLLPYVCTAELDAVSQRINYNNAILTYNALNNLTPAYIYSNKKDTSDFHGTVSFDPIKMSQQNIHKNVYQTSDTQKLVII